MENAGNAVANNTILFKLSFGLPSQTKQAKSDSVEVYKGESGDDVDKGRPDEKSNKLVKNLFTNCIELANIKSLNGGLYRKVKAIAIPAKDMFKDGLFLISLANIKRVNDLLERHEVAHNELKIQFVNRYCQLVNEQRKLLTVLFNEQDYDTEETVQNRITVSSNWMKISFPDVELRGASMAIYEKESAEFKRKLDSTADEIISNLRIGTVAILDKMKENLTVAKGEKPKGFQTSMIQNTMEFINTFRSNNFLGDEELETQLSRLQSVVSGDAEDLTKELKKNVDLRERTLATVNEIRNSVVEMVSRPSRSMILKPKTKSE
jgi:hypothetical protein